MVPTEKQIDGLKELINIGIGRAADVLNTMLNSQIHLNVPFMRTLSADDFKKEMGKLGHDPLAAVELGFRGNFSGSAQLIFTAETASKLVAALVDETVEPEDFDTIRAGTLSEIGNIVLNGVMGSISNMLKFHLDYSVPNYMEGDVGSLLGESALLKEQTILLAKTRFSVEELDIFGDIALFFGVRIFSELLEAINHVDRSSE